MATTATAMMPTGMLTSKTQRQFQLSVMKPPRVGPTMGAIRRLAAMSACVSTTHSARREIGTQTSVESAREPGLSCRQAK